jgi:hypothetical protein
VTVDCDDDDYDGEAYFLSTFWSIDNAVACRVCRQHAYTSIVPPYLALESVY